MESSDERLVVHEQLNRRAASAWFGVAALFEPRWYEFWESNGLTSPQTRVLYALYLDEPLTVSQVGRIIARRPGVATGIVNRLGKLGLVQRRPSERDLRMVEVVLTEGGREIFRQMEAGLPDIVGPLLEGMGRDARRFVDLLERFIRAGGIAPTSGETRTA